MVVLNIKFCWPCTISAYKSQNLVFVDEFIVHLHSSSTINFPPQRQHLVVLSSISWVSKALPLPSPSTSTATGTSRGIKMADSTCGTSGRWITPRPSPPRAPTHRYQPSRRVQPVSLTHGNIQQCPVDSQTNWYDVVQTCVSCTLALNSSCPDDKLVWTLYTLHTCTCMW